MLLKNQNPEDWCARYFSILRLNKIKNSKDIYNQMRMNILMWDLTTQIIWINYWVVTIKMPDTLNFSRDPTPLGFLISVKNRRIYSIKRTAKAVLIIFSFCLNSSFLLSFTAGAQWQVWWHKGELQAEPSTRFPQWMKPCSRSRAASVQVPRVLALSWEGEGKSGCMQQISLGSAVSTAAVKMMWFKHLSTPSTITLRRFILVTELK